MTNQKTIIILLGALLALLIGSSFYVVTESQRAFLFHWGRIVTVPGTQQPLILSPGLHFRVPGMYQDRLFDMRLQTLNVRTTQIITAEKKELGMDSFVRWKIADLPLYYQRMDGNEVQTEMQIQNAFNESLRTVVSQQTLSKIISDESVGLRDALFKAVTQQVQGMGITIVDVGIQHIELPADLNQSIVTNMREDREQLAVQYQIKSKTEAEDIRADADAQSNKTIAEAKVTAAQVRGEGDAEAARIYADAYSKDPGFYTFYRSVNAYKNSFTNKQDILILKPDSYFFQYFNEHRNKPINKPKKAKVRKRK